MNQTLAGIYHGTSRRAALGIFVILTAGLVTTAYFTRHELADAHRAASQEFGASCREIQAKIQVRFAAHDQILRSAGAFFADDDGVTRAEWRDFAVRQKLDQTLPGILGLGFALVVPRAGLADHVQTIRAEGFPDYRVWPEGERETYTSIIFLEPFTGRNLRAFGYDMFSEAVRRAAMERARDADVVALSGKVVLVQEDGRAPQAGVLMYAPVYRRGAPHTTVAERRAALLGWVYSPYRMGDLISMGMLGRWDLAVQRQIHLEIFDGQTTAPAALLYDSQPPRADSPVPIATWETAVVHGGRRWTLRFTSADDTGAIVDYSQAWLILGGGTAVSLLLAGLALSLANTRYGAGRMAERLTAALRASEERWKFALEGSDDGVWDWNVPASTVFFSARWKEMFGYAENEIGSSLDEWSKRVHPEDLARTMADVQAHLDGRTITYVNEHRVRCKDGTWKWILDRGLVVSRDTAGQPLRAIGTHTDITARKQSEAALLESEERLRMLLESSPEAITVHRRGKIIYANPATVRFAGAASAADLLGTPLMDRVHPDFHALVAARVQHMTDTHGSTPPTEMKFVRLDGTLFDVESQATEIVFDGEPAIRVVARDITERKRAAAALAASEENYRLLFAGMLDGFALHEIICDAAGRPVDYRYLSVNPAFERLTQLRAADVVGRTVREILPDTEASWIERYGRVALTGQGEEFEQYSGALNRHFEVAAFCPRPGQFATVFIDITASKRAEAALRESEGRYRALVDWSPEGIVVHRDGKIIYGNPAALRMIGATSSTELLDQPILTRIHPDYHELALQRATLAAGGAALLPAIEVKFLRLDGTTIEVETQTTAIIYNGAPALHVSARDITARKQAEAKLQASQEIIGGILNTIPERVFWKDKNLAYLGCNEAFARDAGFVVSQDLIGKDDFQMGWRNEAEAYRAADREVIESGCPKLFIEETQTTPAGKTIVRLTSKVPLRNAAGEITGVLGTYSDITKWKAAEAALRTSEARYRSILAASPDNITITDLAGRLELVSPASFAMFGYLPDAQVSSYRIYDFIVPEDRDRATGILELKTRGIVVGPTEYRGLRCDGSTFDIEVNSDFLPDEAGRPTGFVFVIRDITARKLTEQALLESEARFRRVLRDIPGVAVQGYAMDGTTTYWNVASEQLYGYTTEEALGRNLLDLIIPAEMNEAVRQAMAHMTSTGEPIPASELLLRRKDGSRVPVFSSHAILQTQGRAAELFCVDIDLSARNEAETALRASEEQFRSYIEHAPMGVFVTDHSGAYVEVNAAAAQTTGYSVAELLALHIRDLLPPGGAAASEAHFHRLLETGQAAGETAFRRKDGSVGFWFVDAVKLSPTRFLASTVETTERKAAEVALQTALREKEALLKEVHHRVKNNLQVITSLLRLEARRSAQPDTKSVLAEMQARIRSMALLHEALYRTGTFAAVDLAHYLRQLATQSFRMLVASPSRVQLRLDLASVHVAMDEAMPCGLLVNELISNALKHGFPGDRSGEIVVELQPVAGSPLWRLRVSDNGAGLAPDLAGKREQSLGLQLVSDFATQLGGTLVIGPAPVAAFTVTFPLSEPSARPA